MFELAVIVDEDSVSNLISERQLKRSNAVRQVRCFTDASEALALLVKGKIFPDLLFLELYISGMGGWAFLDELALSLPPEALRIYILSAWIYGEDHSRCEAHPLIRGMLLKPLNRLSLRALLGPGPSGVPIP